MGSPWKTPNSYTWTLDLLIQSCYKIYTLCNVKSDQTVYEKVNLDPHTQQIHKGTLILIQALSALSLCFDCEQYLCPVCTNKGHSDHLIYSIDGHDSPARRDSFCTKMFKHIKKEGNLKRDKLIHEE